MTFDLPDFCLVALVGTSGSGKSTFAARHFLPSEVLSSDAFRALVADDETRQDATGDAFDALHYLASIRLRRRLLTVVDATNVQDTARKPIVELARKFHAVPVAIVLDVPERVAHERNQARPNRQFGRHVVERQAKDLHRSLRGLKREGFRYVFHLRGDEIDGATFQRVPLWTDKRSETGPFDLIGDIHGCCDELVSLLATLGYAPDAAAVWRHPGGRRLVFLGDLVDRGPKVVETVRLVMNAVQAGAAFCVPGNHDDKLMRALQGKPVKIAHGLQESLDQIAALSDDDLAAFKEDYVRFVDGLVSHLWLDGGRLVAAHAGLPDTMQGRASSRVRDFALYGETTGETDEFGLPVRWNWASEYRGQADVVYGHTPIPAPEWLNHTLNLDTGCVFGGRLTALRWPERELVSVPAARVYAEPIRPLIPPPDPTKQVFQTDIGAQWRHDDLLDVSDYLGRRGIELDGTDGSQRIVIAEGNAMAAMEVMSRYAAHPRWLMYLPPTMSPVETAKDGPYLEHPEQAWDYFAGRGVETVVCQEKHMGSRTVLVVCRDAASARVRFGAPDGETGAILTRTGRPFFDGQDLTRTVLAQASQALQDVGLWDELETDWVCLDAELMPWNAKAQGLLREQYAPVGVAGVQSLSVQSDVYTQAAARGVAGLEMLATRTSARLADVQAYRAAYARYCWDVNGIADLKIAPFHLLAAEGRTFVDKPHSWHIETLARLASVSPLFHATDNLTVALSDPEARQVGTDWWLAKTGAGGEGMVVKPLDFLPPKGCQPAVKVRGREYLRIIYGPEYTDQANLDRLRARGLNAKRGLAQREFRLGIEGLTRFVSREPLRRVHECAFAVLALESEAVDPRL